MWYSCNKWGSSELLIQIIGTGSTHRPAWARRCSAQREGQQLWRKPSWTRPLCPGAVCRVNTGRACCLSPSWRWNRPATSSATPAGWTRTAPLRRKKRVTFKRDILIQFWVITKWKGSTTGSRVHVLSSEPSHFYTTSFLSLSLSTMQLGTERLKHTRKMFVPCHHAAQKKQKQNTFHMLNLFELFYAFICFLHNSMRVHR